MAVQDISFLNYTPLTFSKDCSLSSHLLKLANDLLVPINEPVQRVGYPYIIAELLHELLSSPQVVSWHSREEMVHGLKL